MSSSLGIYLPTLPRRFPGPTTSSLFPVLTDPKGSCDPHDPMPMTQHRSGLRGLDTGPNTAHGKAPCTVPRLPPAECHARTSRLSPGFRNPPCPSARDIGRRCRLRLPGGMWFCLTHATRT